MNIHTRMYLVLCSFFVMILTGLVLLPRSLSRTPCHTRFRRCNVTRSRQSTSARCYLRRSDASITRSRCRTSSRTFPATISRIISTPATPEATRAGQLFLVISYKTMSYCKLTMNNALATMSGDEVFRF